MSNIREDYLKCVSVIISCKQQKQLNSANRLIENFHNKWLHTINRIKEKHSFKSIDEAKLLQAELSDRHSELVRLSNHQQWRVR